MFQASLLRDVSARALLSALSVAILAPVADAQTASPPPAASALPAVVVTAPKPRVARKVVAQRPARVAPAPVARVVRRTPARPIASAAPTPGPAAQPPLPTLARWSPNAPSGGPAFVQRFQLPSPAVASITRKQIDEQINAVDAEDTVKYFPSLFVRKRNDGDTQAVLATRTWGLSSSARSLVYMDDILITALVGNDNSIGAPRWGLVAPEEIERVDFLYGPFSAAYPGNSIGGVLQITTRMPEKLEVNLKQTESFQTFSLWGTKKTYATHITSASIGDRINDFSWFASGNISFNKTQPLTYVTTAGLYPWPGMVLAANKVGNPANVLGAAGQLDQVQGNAKLKLAYDFTPTIRGTYQVGFWSNDSSTFPDNYIGTFGTAAGATALGAAVLQSFGSAWYRVQEQMLTNAVSLKSATNGIFDFDLSFANFSYLKSDQLSPYSAVAGSPYFTPNGKDVKFGGTYWNLLDLKGIWRPEFFGKHEMSFGFHADEYHLNNPTYLTSGWTAGQSSAFAVASNAQGTTRTQALWLQDAWRFHPDFKLTIGGRWENWQARDGYNQQIAAINALGTDWGKTPANLNSDIPIFQPNLHHTRFSPKGSLQWTPNDDWKVTGSIGLANRFPTVKELYNLTTIAGATGVIANPNPNLRPEVSLNAEIAVERRIGADGSVRVSMFSEEVRDAIVSQNIFVAGAAAPVASIANIDKVRNRGVEVSFRKDNFLIDRFELSGSATFVDSRILADAGWAGGAAANNDLWNWSPVGKNMNYVPKWRWTLVGTYRPTDNWTITAAARWQDRMWSTISNNDIAHGVYQSFDRFFVVDAKVKYKLNDKAEFAAGVDNLGNYKYFLFHPFPQRTFTLSGKFQIGSKDFNDIGVFRPARM
jgi:iron complex outermembrane receptor protein